MRFGESSYRDTLGKRVRLSPLINSDGDEALQRVVEGIGSGGRTSRPLEGGGEPSSSAKMQLISGNSHVQSLQSLGRLKPVLMVSLVVW